MALLENLFSFSMMDMLKYILISGTFYVICYILYKKSLASAKIQERIISKKDIKREIYYSLLSSVIMTFIIVLILNTPLVRHTLLYTTISDYSILWLIASIPIGMFIHDTYFYWLHRLLHHKKLFRHIHLVHHQSNNPTPFASYSFHILEAVGEGLILPLLLFIIPLHPFAIYTFLLFSFIINVYGHLGYEIAPQWFRTSFLFGILNTSVYHNLHHSKFHGNYGLYFRFWDRIMGTENPKYIECYDEIQNNRFPQ
ncbi:sterol desaturase family protein [Chryseobacterium carnipullorum]|uniref:Fatty acid hydroxylase superfamily n=1 Tax=Chryseobacterium carnipullorum TaxID=1124835 RepID=A0A1M7BGR9_CHRCU|nr:sterol desaturase family protein [Chryseobacterium carnipullorum]AZA48430.1 sterol desaturase family protein [Chryseobacterium carnipullorum]AZA63362.1 sterol desaturase family protein [Chryseobacterium carnipullorum]SHL54144.1 Sterol desaturase/sphingolipid hydroxylase, fatty acid hydroxylase superfamily [Chryseobacterium carnipullorum]STC92267.1 Fatty acid hydroxylase superfamily [Chryseobacterium carnipullorum]